MKITEALADKVSEVDAEILLLTIVICGSLVLLFLGGVITELRPKSLQQQCAYTCSYHVQRVTQTECICEGK